MIPIEWMFAIILWLLGSIFIILVFEPAEGTPPANLVLLALFWPFYTVFIILHEIFTPYRD